MTRRALLLCLGMFACGQHRSLDPIGPKPESGPPSTGTELTLQPGQSYQVPGTTLVVGFDGVSEDSRCPADVICVREGDAAVALSASLGRSVAVPFTLHTTLVPRDTVLGPYRITLQRLDPYPISTQLIHASEYRATLRVAALPD